MKFSYPLLKKFVPKLKSKEQAIDLLCLHAFEAEDAGGNAIDVSLPANRYSGAASVLGLARELAAILKTEINKEGVKALPLPAGKQKISPSPKAFGVSVREKKACPRYAAQLFERVKVGASPKWMQEALVDCGMRPINAVVDIVNYVMLETGQPLHAFDYDKLAAAANGRPELVVRKAREGESIVSIDGIRYELSPDMLVVADKKNPLVVAGVKGGTGCEVTEETTRVLVESANFDFVSVLKTSKKLGLATDASARFSHNLSPALVETGLDRAAQAMVALLGAKAGERFDTQTAPLPKKLVRFDVYDFNKLTGMELSAADAEDCLRRLGFADAKKGLWEVPADRTDVSTPEDLAEEIVRLRGYASVPSVAPLARLAMQETDPLVALKDVARNMLVGQRFSEVMNHSFVSEKDLAGGLAERAECAALVNPVSAEYEFLRPALANALVKNVAENMRFAEEVRIFEVGDVFAASPRGIEESVRLGLALGGKRETFFELKGVVAGLLRGAGLDDFRMKEIPVREGALFGSGALEIIAGGKQIGLLGIVKEGVSVAEIKIGALAGLVGGDRAYEAPSKYPAVMRDVSVMVSLDARIGELMKAVQDWSDLVEAVDLIDEYSDDRWTDEQSVTFRLVFRSRNRTLSGEEADAETAKITAMLKHKFGAAAR